MQWLCVGVFYLFVCLFFVFLQIPATSRVSALGGPARAEGALAQDVCVHRARRSTHKCRSPKRWLDVARGLSRGPPRNGALSARNWAYHPGDNRARTHVTPELSCLRLRLDRDARIGLLRRKFVPAAQLIGSVVDGLSVAKLATGLKSRNWLANWRSVSRPWDLEPLPEGSPGVSLRRRDDVAPDAEPLYELLMRPLSTSG
jgi:hypothetical protein